MVRERLAKASGSLALECSSHSPSAKDKHMKTFKVKEKCKACKGTGLYVGIGERDGVAVVCYICGGTGCEEFEHKYKEFTKRTRRKGIKRVLQVNPGIVASSSPDFGGISYNEWAKGDKFSQGSEMRQYTCPAWWYQSADHYRKPDWKACVVTGSFSGCKQFKNKQLCWQRFDREQRENTTTMNLLDEE